MARAHAIQTLSVAAVAVGVAACAPTFDANDPAMMAPIPPGTPTVAESPPPLPDDDPPGELYKDDGVHDDDVGVLDYHIWPGPGL